jgi:hypothetical protein
LGGTVAPVAADLGVAGSRKTKSGGGCAFPVSLMHVFSVFLCVRLSFQSMYRTSGCDLFSIMIFEFSTIHFKEAIDET